LAASIRRRPLYQPHDSGGKAAERPKVARDPFAARQAGAGWRLKVNGPMAAYDFRTHRLYVEAPLAAAAAVRLDRTQTNYLVNVLRQKSGDPVLLFNGRDGEWRASLAEVTRKGAVLAVAEQTRPQTAPGDLHYLFAPLKHARLDYMVQKAVELGVSRLVPVRTRHGQVARVNLERMRANAIEAAEQCGILALPEIAAPAALEALLADWVPERLLVFCDEDAPVEDPVTVLARARNSGSALVGPMPVSVLVGPEGGFSEGERAALMNLPNLLRLSLGPRILRADTAAVAVLALVQAALGDWR
jgi:16S rRNA (uracil1498-N3)-methyltransferase